MKYSRTARPGILVTLGLAFFLAAATATADVTIQQKTVSSGMGGFGDGTSVSTMVIAGDRSRSDDDYTYTGRFKTLAGGGRPKHSANITRLDRELTWQLNDDKQQCTELTFEEMRRMMAEGIAVQRDAGQKPQDVDMDFKVDVKRTGNKDTVNGFAAEQVIITVTGTARDKQKGGEGTMTLTMEQWLAPSVPGQAEVQAFYRKFADKLGIDPELQRMGGAAMALYGNAIRRAAEEMKGLKGYPVRSIMKIGGAALSPEQQAQLQQAKEQHAKERAEASKDAARGEKAEDAQAAIEAGSQAKSGNVGGAVGGFLARKLARAAGKKAQQQADKQVDQQADATTAGGGGGFTVTTDVLSVKTGPAVGVSFEVPAGYKKVEEKLSSPKSKGK